MKNVILLICLALILVSCRSIPVLQLTSTPIPPTPTKTPTPTITPIPPTPTSSPSPSPEPTLSPDTNEKIDNLATMAGVYLITENEQYKDTVINGVVDYAAELNIDLSVDDLMKASYDERFDIIERIGKSIKEAYGSKGYAIFLARCYANGISIDLLWDAEDLAYKDIDEKRAYIELSASYLAEAIDAAKNVSVDNQIILEGEAIHDSLINLSTADPLVKGSINDAASVVFEWARRLIKYLLDSSGVQ